MVDLEDDWTALEPSERGRALVERREALRLKQTDLKKLAADLYVKTHGMPHDDYGTPIDIDVLWNRIQTCLSNLERGIHIESRIYFPFIKAALDDYKTELENRKATQEGHKISTIVPFPPMALNRTGVLVVGLYSVYPTVGGWGGSITMDVDAVDVRILGPVLEEGSEVFGFRMSGSSMEPKYESGEVLWVDPNRECVIGDGVLLCPTDPQKNGTRYVGKLISGVVGDSWVIRQYNPAAERSFPKRDWPGCMVVVCVTPRDNRI